MNIDFGGAPVCPAGIWKIETIKNLSKALAIKVSLFNRN